jgi:hypothetical protein
VWSGGLFAVGSDDDVDLDSLTVQGRAVICRRFAHSPGDTYDFLVETVRQARKSVIGAYSTLHDHPLMLLALEYGAFRRFMEQKCSDLSGIANLAVPVGSARMGIGSRRSHTHTPLDGSPNSADQSSAGLM